MLYEEALYTVLHRAGTMGPDQVDDEEVLLSYLQQVSRAPLWGGLRCGMCVQVCMCSHTHPHRDTHPVASITWMTHRVTSCTHHCTPVNMHSG